MTRRPGRSARVVIMAGLVIAACWGVMGPRATTRQGMNYQVSERTLPLYVKAIDFLHRHYAYRHVVDTIVERSASDHARLLAIFEWTRRQIRPTPADWPIVDDHILHIIIRGYGTSDQMADVFTTLLVYAGVPAFWKVVWLPQESKPLILSFARVQGRWIVCDVANGFLFKNAQGEFASVEEIVTDPSLVTLTAGTMELRGIPYVKYFEDFIPPPIPDPLRAQLQMPWPRMAYELRRAWHGVRF